MVRERLTLESRQIIEHMLNEKHSLSEIAAALMKNRSTIGREVKAHITIRRTGGRGFCYNNCVNRYTCTRTHICYPCKVSHKQILCRRCNLCNLNCNINMNLLPACDYKSHHMFAMAAVNPSIAHLRSIFTLLPMPIRITVRFFLNLVWVCLTLKKNSRL